MVVIPVATQRQVRTALSVQRTVVIPRVQFLDLGVVPQVQLCGVVDVSCDHAETSFRVSRQVVDVPVVQVVVWGVSCHRS